MRLYGRCFCIGIVALAAGVTAIPQTQVLVGRAAGSGFPSEVDLNGDGRNALYFFFTIRDEVGTGQGSAVEEVAPVIPAVRCRVDEREWNYLSQELVFSYDTGDQILGRLVEGFLCLEPVDYLTGHAELNYEIVGGAGRFDGATGSLRITLRNNIRATDFQGGYAMSAFVGQYVAVITIEEAASGFLSVE